MQRDAVIFASVKHGACQQAGLRAWGCPDEMTAREEALYQGICSLCLGDSHDLPAGILRVWAPPRT